MVQCDNCGAPCGRRHPTAAFDWRCERFLCDKCAREQAKTAGRIVLGVIFLAFSAVLTAAFLATVLQPLALVSGYSVAKGVAIGTGVGCIVFYFVLRYVSGRVKGCVGCLVRLLSKVIGLMAYALGIGLLIVAFLCEDTLKEAISDGQPSESEPVQTSPESEPTAAQAS